PALDGRSVLVQGVGAVGRRLAEMLAGAGARLVLADVDESRAKEAGAAISAEVDVFSPCATGGILNEATIPRLRCRIVAGAANNQLAEPADAERLAKAGILYAPDYVINAGGIIHLASLELLGEDRTRLEERLRGIGNTLGEVFRLAEAEGISTGAAADRLVEQRLAAGPGA